MATTRKIPVKTAANARAPGLGEAEQVTDIDPPPANEPPPPDDLQMMMAELAGNTSSSVTVYRTGKGQPRAYVFKCTPDAFSLDVLRDKYNGGEFQLFITKNGQLWKNKTVFVEPPQTRAEPTPPAVPDGLALLREDMRKQAEMMTNVLKTLAAPPPAPRPLLEGVNLMELVQSAGALLAMLRPPAPPPSSVPVESSINLLMKGFELAREMKADAGGDGDTSLLGIVKELVKSPMLGAAIQAAAAAVPQQPQMRPVQPRIPARAPAPPAATATPPTPPAAPAQPSFAGETVHPMMKMYLGQLVAKAAEQSDPGIYADLILDNLDEASIQLLLNAQPTAVDALAQHDPRVLEHREWFEELANILAEALAPDEGPAVPLAPSINAGEDNAAGSSAPPVSGDAAAG